MSSNSSNLMTIEGPEEVRPSPVARSRERAGPCPEPRVPLTSASAVVLATLLGLCAGYLDLAIIVYKKLCLNPEGYYRMARDFPWSVPVAHAALMLIPGMLLAALVRLRPGLISLRLGAWVLATPAIWGALLRMPMYGWCSLALAGGLARPVASALAARRADARRWRPVPAAILGVLGLLAAGSSGWQAFREYRALSSLPAAPSQARNVVLIVWDTVRAHSLSLYGYPHRATTPNLEKWAARGVTYHYALAPAPWTVPSHSCFFTGRWPLQIDSQWKPVLDTPDPTLAEYLASRGYQTAGFAANTNCLTYEGGLNRGFAHFEDYAMDPASLLARTVPGQWLLGRVLHLVGDHYDERWLGLQSRGAAGINRTFLDWLGRRRTDRPFFAFLNYFDAHDVYMPPPDYTGRFGIRPTTRREFQFLEDFEALNKGDINVRDFLMARDCYDDCIAYLDDQLGRLLEQLQARGLLADTEVIITSDHGESFGEHGYVNHSFSAHIEELRVPLVILSPDAPTGTRVFHAVSLRDLPATVVDRLGLSDRSPFPGRSLAGYWRLPPGQLPSPPTTPAFSEQANRAARTLLRPLPGPGGVYPGSQMSLVDWDHQYIRDGEGKEQLYDLSADLIERNTLVDSPSHKATLEAFRAKLLEILTESPGSPAVERVYLQDFRRSLEAIVRGKSADEHRVAAEGPGPSRRPDS